MAEGEKAAESSSSHITLKVLGQDQSEVFCRIKRCTPLKILMNAYCENRSVAFGTFAFLFDGKHLLGDQTPDEVKLEEGDEIDAMLHQDGGRT